jgi:CheY-like chemotaxis protein
MVRTVLIADDDRALVAVLSEALAEEGYNVRIAYDGRMAIEAIQHASADLVIADIQMPRMSGLELHEAIRSRPRPVPVVLMSAWPALAAREDVVVLEKPFDLDQVLATVASALSSRGAE